MKMKQSGVTETKLYQFHRIFKNVGGGGGGGSSKPLEPYCICHLPISIISIKTKVITSRQITLVEIYRETISTVMLFPSAESFKKGCCQLQAKVCA